MLKVSTHLGGGLVLYAARSDVFFVFFSGRRRHTRSLCDWSSDVCSSDLLFLGDVAGRAGRRAVKERLPGLIKELAVSCVIVNAENAASGIGITESTAKEIFRAGAQARKSVV